MLRDIRLVQAHRLLSDTSCTPTVADVAYRCGFGHLSRFAITNRERFGESPSATLSRVHGHTSSSWARVAMHVNTATRREVEGC
jgi:transcriptional regulator GlxA family with amidase domain